MSQLYTLMLKAQEAQAVRLGIEIPRQFTDAELAESTALLEQAERELYGADPRDESGCPLSAAELTKLRDLDRKVIPFLVTVTTAEGATQINVLATDACMASTRAAEIMFPDFDCEKPMAFKIKVEPINVVKLKEAA